MSEVSSKIQPIDELVLCCTGPMIWAIHFFVMYGTEALTCTVAPSRARNIFLVVGTATTAIALIILVGLIMWGFAKSRANRQAGKGFSGSSFLRDIGTALAVLALLGVLWVVLPTTWLALCAAS